MTANKQNRRSATSSRAVPSGRNRDAIYGRRMSQPLTSCGGRRKTCVAPANSWQHLDYARLIDCRRRRKRRRRRGGGGGKKRRRRNRRRRRLRRRRRRRRRGGKREGEEEEEEEEEKKRRKKKRRRSVTARVWCRGRIDRKRNSTINLTTDSGACY